MKYYILKFILKFYFLFEVSSQAIFPPVIISKIPLSPLFFFPLDFEKFQLPPDLIEFKNPVPLRPPSQRGVGRKPLCLVVSCSVFILALTWIYYLKLTAQISAQLGLGILLRLEAPSDLRVDIVKMQQLLVMVSEAVPLTMTQRVAFEKQSLNYTSEVENFIQSLTSFLISLVVTSISRP